MQLDSNCEGVYAARFRSRTFQIFRLCIEPSKGDEHMSFAIESRYFEDVVVVVPIAYRDERGFFVETYRADHFEKLGLPTRFVQDNQSLSRKGVIRGLHFQWDQPMG